MFKHPYIFKNTSCGGFGSNSGGARRGGRGFSYIILVIILLVILPGDSYLFTISVSLFPFPIDLSVWTATSAWRRQLLFLHLIGWWVVMWQEVNKWMMERETHIKACHCRKLINNINSEDICSQKSTFLPLITGFSKNIINLFTMLLLHMIQHLVCVIHTTWLFQHVVWFWT